MRQPCLFNLKILLIMQQSTLLSDESNFVMHTRQSRGLEL